MASRGPKYLLYIIKREYYVRGELFGIMRGGEGARNLAKGPLVLELKLAHLLRILTDSLANRPKWPKGAFRHLSDVELRYSPGRHGSMVVPNGQ